ncbi:MAG: MGMT family protein [Thermomicrobiales bacterium]
MTAQDAVRRVIAQIPPGRVTTYGAIARASGLGIDARRVGWIIAGLKEGHDLPCHRVVNAQGHLSGGWAFGHPDRMKAMLEEEGVRFVGPYDVDISRHFWQLDESPSADEVNDLENIP